MKFVQLIVIIHLICFLNAAKFKKLTVQELDKTEVEALLKSNETNVKNGIRPIFFNREFMKIAQKEAERFASQSRLSMPKFTTNLKYVCFLYKIISVQDKQWSTYTLLFIT